MKCVTVDKPKQKTRQKEKPAHAKPWQVVVHDDPVNLMNYVSMVFQKVFGYSKEKAEKLMREVHELKRSIVWTGAREKAEHYVHLLHQYQLQAALEQDS